MASGDFIQTLNADFRDRESLNKFNADPGVYVMVIKEDMQEVVKPFSLKKKRMLMLEQLSLRWSFI